MTLGVATTQHLIDIGIGIGRTCLGDVQRFVQVFFVDKFAPGVGGVQAVRIPVAQRIPEPVAEPFVTRRFQIT